MLFRSLKSSLLEGADGFVWNQRGWAFLAIGREREARDSFSITMPGWISSHTGNGLVDRTTISYTARAGDTLDFEVVGGGFNSSAVLAIGGGALLLLVGLIAGLRLLRAPSATARERASQEIAIGAGMRRIPPPSGR